MGKIEGKMGKSKEEGGGEGRGNGGIITGGSIVKKKSKKNKTSKKAKGKTFQVVREANVPKKAITTEGSDDSEDDTAAIRAANAKAISQRQHQQRVTAEQRAKAKDKESAKKGAAEPGLKPKTEKPGGKNPENPSSGQGKAAGKADHSKLKVTPTKKAPQAEDDMESSDDSDSDDRMDWTQKADPEDDEFSSDSGSDVDEINVSFDFVDPVEADFHGIKLFLMNLLDGNNFDSSGLVDLMLEQAGEVGTVIKVVGEDEVYGFMSVVDMRTSSSTLCLKEIGDFILKKCPPSQHDAFARVLRGKTGLIVCERMINVPPELAVPLLDAFCSELQQAQQDQKNKGKYRFDNFVLLTQLLREGSADGVSTKKKKKGKGEGVERTGGEGSEGGGSVTWLKAEDECFSNHAHAAFEFELSKEPEEGFHYFGKAMIVAASKLEAVRGEVLELVGDEALRNQHK